MTLQEEIQSKQEEIITFMREALKQTEQPEQPETEARQFLIGYLRLVENASKGDMSTRDEYIESVIPAVKQAGMALGYILGTLVVVKMALSAKISTAHFNWYAGFSYDYTERLLKAWEAA